MALSASSLFLECLIAVAAALHLWLASLGFGGP